jgi:hypothetical protein
VHPRLRTFAFLPCALTLLFLALPARASADIGASLFSSPTTCPGAPAGDPLTVATDTTSPPTGWQAADVTVSLTGTNVGAWEWRIGCGTTQTGPAGATVVFNVSGQYVLSHRVRDTSNRWTNWVDDTIQLDKTTPLNTTSVSSAWSATGVAVSVTGSDDVSSVAKVHWKLDSGAWTFGPSGSSVSVTGDGVHTLQTKVEDAAGNQSAIRSDSVRIDGTAPTNTTSPPVGWQYATTSVAVTGTDAGSGVDHVEWKLDGGALGTGPGGSSVPIPDGTHTLQTRVLDVAGNASAWTSSTVMVDTTAPQDMTSVPATWQTTAFVDAVVTGTDPNGSGIHHVDWELDGVAGTATGTSRTVRVSGDGDHVLKTRVADAGGRDSGWTTRHVKIDTVIPTDATAPAAGWQTLPVDVAVTGTDAHSGVERVEWQLDGGASQNSTANPRTVTVSGDGQHSLLSRVRDVAGNISGWKTSTIRIDATAPRNTTPTGSSAWRATPYTVVLSGEDDVSGLFEMRYRIDGGAVSSGPSGVLQATVTGTGSHTLTTWAVDLAGNQSGLRNETINIDTVAPTDTTTAPSAPVPNRYPVTINGTDAHSGLVTVKWKLDGGVVQSGAPGTSVTISGDGPHTLQTMVVDGVGNDSGWASRTITVDISLTPDTTAPTDTSTTAPGWTAGAVTITVKATDAGVGVDYVQWRLDGVLSSGRPSGTTVTITGDGAHELETRAVDLVGNTSAWRSQTVRIDTAIPTDTTSLPEGWAATRDFALSGDDATSGVATIEYQLDGGATQTVANRGTASFASDGSHTLRRRVIDAAGQATPWTLTTLKIDTVLPTNTSAAAPMAWQTSSGVSLALAGTDALSGVDRAEWRIDGGAVRSGSPAVVSSDGVKLLETRIVDKAGNASAWRGETVRIDRVAPANTTPVLASGWTNTSFNAAVSGTDATSGVLKVEWRLDDGPVQNAPSVSVTAAGAHRLMSRVIDVAGNASPWRTDSVGIDAVEPTLTVSCGSTEWRSTAPTCSLDADGGLSGLASLTGARGDAAPQAIGSGYVVDADGAWTLTFRAADGAGNAKVAQAQVNVDSTAPSAAVSCATGAGTGYVCTATGSDGLSGLSGLTWSLNGGRATAVAGGGTFAVQKGAVTVTATDRAGNVGASAPVTLADRTADKSKASATPRSTSEAVLLRGKGSVAARALGEFEVTALPHSTTVDLRPLALGKGRFQISLKLSADRRSKTVSKSITTRSGYSPRLSLKLGGAADVSVKLTVDRRSRGRWVTLAKGSATL